MLAEVVVVSVVVASVLVTMYISLNRISSAYETRNRYYDIDAEYYAIAANDYMIKNNTTNIEPKLSNIYIGLNYSSANAYYVTQLDTFTSNKQTFTDYINYLKENIDPNTSYDYMIITELCKTQDDCYYYTLKVGDTDD